MNMTPRERGLLDAEVGTAFVKAIERRARIDDLEEMGALICDDLIVMSNHREEGDVSLPSGGRAKLVREEKKTFYKITPMQIMDWLRAVDPRGVPQIQLTTTRVQGP